MIPALLGGLLAVAGAPLLGFGPSALSDYLQFPTTPGPVVRLDYGAFQGKQEGGIASFLGIPYSQPPVGALRFAAPRPPTKHYLGRQAKEYGPGCYSQILTMNPDLKLPMPKLDPDVVDEDCLSVNVYKPADVAPDAKLPVIFFIHGGGFALGTTSKMDAGSHFVGRSIAFGAPLVYVSANYRTNAFGFLAGDALEAEGGLNAGLHDQRMALQWAQKYVHLFGGDPAKVTVWGQSAGAISIGLHMIMRGAGDLALFRGAVMQSGSPMPIGSRAQGQEFFVQLAGLAGCPPGERDSKKLLECLRRVPSTDLVRAINTSPNLFGYESIRLAWQPRVDGVLFDEDPSVSVREGRVVNIPFISGACEDEGTLFSLGSLNVSSNDEFKTYVKHVSYLTDDQAERVAKVYPDDQTLGSPFGTSDKFKMGPQYKRLSAFQGDWIFQAPKRHFLSQTRGTHKDVWSYAYKRGKGKHYLGTTHGTDFAALRRDPKGYDFLINFAHNLDPNVAVHPDSALPAPFPWPRYANGADPAGPGALLAYLDPDRFALEKDDYREVALRTVAEIGLEQAGAKLGDSLSGGGDKREQMAFSL